MECRNEWDASMIQTFVYCLNHKYVYLKMIWVQMYDFELLILIGIEKLTEKISG